MSNFLVNTTNSLNTFFIRTNAQTGPPTNYTTSGTDVRNNFTLYMHGIRSKCNYQVGGVDIGTYYQRDTPNFVYNMGAYNFNLSPWGTLDPKLNNAYWIWATPNACLNSPGSDNGAFYWFYYTFYYSGSQNTGTIYVVCDNIANVWFNNIAVSSTLITGGGWGSVTAPSAPVTINNGLNYIRIAAYNTGSGSTGTYLIVGNSSSGTAGSNNTYTYTSVGGTMQIRFTETTTFTILLIAGGGGAGYDGGGGGGGGGVYTNTLTLSPAIYTITLGGGGAAATSTSVIGSNGGNSSFIGGTTSIICYGGGGGGSNHNSSAAGNGGSGGGRGAPDGAGAGQVGTFGTGISGQGNNGGDSSDRGSGGGGGGYSGAGGNGSSSGGGNGANGILSSISGTSTWYAGGGGGGTWAYTTAGTGGLGGGGNGAAVTGNGGNATYYGGGGGGNGNISTGGALSGSGYQGICIISISNSYISAGGGTAGPAGLIASVYDSTNTNNVANTNSEWVYSTVSSPNNTTSLYNTNNTGSGGAAIAYNSTAT